MFRIGTSSYIIGQRRLVRKSIGYMNALGPVREIDLDERHGEPLIFHQL